MNLVTVTCERDHRILLLQAKSIQKFVEKCTHWIIINDQNPYSIDWQSLLSPYYDNERHILKIIYHDPKYWKLAHNGWIIQQILKLEAINFVQDDYLLLDSKNFFVVTTDLATWKNDGCGVLVSEQINSEVYEAWGITNQLYAGRLGMPILKIYYATETPFFIKKEIVIDAITHTNFAEWFIKDSNFKPGPSEFLYYSYFLTKNNHQFKWSRRHHCLWPDPNHLYHVNKWFKESDFNLMEICGIHRVWIERANLETKQKVVNWLNDLGILDEHTKQIFSLEDE